MSDYAERPPLSSVSSVQAAPVLATLSTSMVLAVQSSYTWLSQLQQFELLRLLQVYLTDGRCSSTR